MHVAVIGAGIIGAALADVLVHKGAMVTVLDAAAREAREESA